MLDVDDSVMMSDSFHERLTNVAFVKEARGHVLIAGLGLGMVLHPVCAKRAVKSVTVIEVNPDVIALVQDSLPQTPKLQVIAHDIHTWTPAEETRYDTIYFDIWPNLSPDHVREMVRLERRFRPWLAPKGWMASWCKEKMRRL